MPMGNKTTDSLDEKIGWIPEGWHVLQVQYRTKRRAISLGYIGSHLHSPHWEMYYTIHPGGKWHKANGFSGAIRKVLIRRGLRGQTNRVIPVPWQWHEDWV